MLPQTLDPQRLFFPDTASRPGRHLAGSPKNSDLEYLQYGRIQLDAGPAATAQRSVAAVEVSTEGQADLVECAAEVAGEYPLQIVRYADVAKAPGSSR